MPAETLPDTTTRAGAEAHLGERGASLRMGLAAAALGAPLLVGFLAIGAMLSGAVSGAGELALLFGLGVVGALALVGVFSQLLTGRSAPELLTTVQQGTARPARVEAAADGGVLTVAADDGLRWTTAPTALVVEPGAPATVWVHEDAVAVGVAGGVFAATGA